MDSSTPEKSPYSDKSPEELAVDLSSKAFPGTQVHEEIKATFLYKLNAQLTESIDRQQQAISALGAKIDRHQEVASTLATKISQLNSILLALSFILILAGWFVYLQL